jgi:tubby and related proteins
MPFSSMIQEMKGEIGAISRRGLLRSRSHSTGRVQRVEEPDEAAMRESSWAHVPPELLREVLAKVEAVEARWPGRGAVVACAGVCRGWRGAVKEIVRAPEASGRLTFPISLKQVWFPRILNLCSVIMHAADIAESATVPFMLNRWFASKFSVSPEFSP